MTLSVTNLHSFEALPNWCALVTVSVTNLHNFGGRSVVVPFGCRQRPLQDVLDAHIMQRAAVRHGVLSTKELVHEFGRTRASISRARHAGIIIDVLPGVVRLTSSADTFLGRCHALQIRFGDVGVLSGWTAGRLMGLRAMRREPMFLTVREGVRRSPPPWAALHLTRWFDDDVERWRHPDGLVTASPMRTLWSLAALFNQHRFERAAEDAWHLGLVTPAEAAIYLDQHRCRGKDGVLRLETWLERSAGHDRPAQSNLERHLLQALERQALPIPARQHSLELATGEIVHLDIAWPTIRLAVEPGASWWHGGDLGMGRDQARDRACGEVGWQVVRFDETARNDIDGAAAEVARIYHRRRADLRNGARVSRPA